MSLRTDFAFGERQSAKMEKNLIKKLRREYQKALKEVKGTIAGYYEKYNMTFQELNKYNRLVNLQKEIEQQLSGMSRNAGAAMRKGLEDIYTESYYMTGFAMEKNIQAKLSYTLIDQKVITASIQNPISGLTLNERLRNRRREVIIRTKSAITQGLIQGESYSKMAKRITKGVDMEYNKAERIARTEAHRVQQVGRRESIEHAEDKGVVGSKVWLATLDGRTRDSHQEMDGQKADKDGYFTFPSGGKAKEPGGSGIPEEDINCRCDVRYEIAGFEPKDRRVRGEGVVPYKTYNEWKKNRLSG